MIDFNLYLITDRRQTAGRQLPAVVAEALAGGVNCVQLREKDLPACQLFEIAVELRRITLEHGARLLINDRIDVAMAVGANGVHLGVSSLPVAEARRLLGSERLIGYSAHRVEEALQAEQDGADFISFGPVYHTPSKASYGEPPGLAQLSKAVKSLTIPVFALGGVKKTSVADVMATGCHGIALISAILTATKPKDAARSILSAMTEYTSVS